MTETFSPSPPPPTRSGRRLERHPDDKLIAGVCAGLGRYTDTDPVLWRVAVATLVLLGGAGVGLYAIGWLLMPSAGAQSAADKVLRRADHRGGPGGIGARRVVFAVLAGIIVLASMDNGGPGIAGVAVLAGLAYLVYRDRTKTPAPGGSPSYGPIGSPPTWSSGPAYAAPAGTGPPPGTPDVGSPAEADAGAAPSWDAAGPSASIRMTPSWTSAPPSYDPYDPIYDTAPAWPQAPPPKQPRSALGQFTLSVAMLVAGALVVLRLLGVDAVTTPRVLAAALLVVGTGLVVGTWIGRARWLAFPGLLLALAMAMTSAGQRLDLPAQGGVGQRLWVIDSSSAPAAFQLGAGDAVLDLSASPTTVRRDVSVRIGVGELLVKVPAGLTVQVRHDLGVGEVSRTEVEDADDSGDQEVVASGPQADGELAVGPPGAPDVVLDVTIGAGDLEVRHVRA